MQGCQEKRGDRAGGSGRWPGYVMSTKVIFRRAEVFVLAEVCLPRRLHAVLPRSQVLSEKRKWCIHVVPFVRHYMKSLLFFQTSDRRWPACGRLGSEDRLPLEQTSARLKITFVDITYPKGWTGSLPLRPLIFSWGCLLVGWNRIEMLPSL